MATYYATVKVEGTASSQDIKVQASSGSEAKKIIEMRVGGKVKSWIRSPIPQHKPPRWFRG